MKKKQEEEPPSGGNGLQRQKNTPFLKKTRGKLARLLMFGNGEPSLKEEVVELIEEHDPEGTKVSSEERSIVSNVLGLVKKDVSDIMVPRADIVAVENTITLLQLKKIFIESELTRIPVYKNSLDNVIGFIHIKDLIPYLGGRPKKEFSINSILRTILFAPPSMKVMDLMLKMQAEGVHLALVLDEYGGTDGLVTMEDLVETILGEIRDEHDAEHAGGDENIVKQINESSFEANARMSVKMLEEKLGVELTAGETGGEDFDTLGGLVFFLLGHVPEKGEIAKHPSGIEFEVVDADPRKVLKLIVRKTHNE